MLGIVLAFPVRFMASGAYTYDGGNKLSLMP